MFSLGQVPYGFLKRYDPYGFLKRHDPYGFLKRHDPTLGPLAQSAVKCNAYLLLGLDSFN
jgi:hypothetical protein